jgi:hypothetical protein
MSSSLRVTTEQQFFHLYHCLLRVAPRAVGVLLCQNGLQPQIERFAEMLVAQPDLMFGAV